MTPLRLYDIPEVLEVQVVPSNEVEMVEKPTVTNVLFPYVTPLCVSVLLVPLSLKMSEVFEVQVVPLVEVRIVPDVPTAIKFGNTVKEVIASVLLAFPPESLTIIVHSE